LLVKLCLLQFEFSFFLISVGYESIHVCFLLFNYRVDESLRLFLSLQCVKLLNKLLTFDLDLQGDQLLLQLAVVFILTLKWCISL